MTAPVHTIEALCERSHAISLEKGWVTEKGDPRSFATITALNHTELSEAFEDYRGNRGLTELFYEVKGQEGSTIELEGEPGDPRRPFKEAMSAEKYRALVAESPPGIKILEAKPCGIPIELADFVIRVCQHVGTAGKGPDLDARVGGRMGEDCLYPDLDTLIAEVHLSVSLAYSAKKTEQDDAYLEYLADALCEVFSFCRRNDINLWAAIDEKEAFNRTRPIKHGGKKV